MKLADMLQKQGFRVVDQILAELSTCKVKRKFPTNNSRGCPIFHLIGVMIHLAEPRHARQLSEMLLWDEIALSNDRSTREGILGILEKIGSPAIIPLLREYAEKVKGAGYSDSYDKDGTFVPAKPYYQGEQKKVEQVIASCQIRD